MATAKKAAPAKKTAAPKKAATPKQAATPTKKAATPKKAPALGDKAVGDSLAELANRMKRAASKTRMAREMKDPSGIGKTLIIKKSGAGTGGWTKR